MSRLVVRPCTLKQANELISAIHRHHKPVVGHRFSIAVYDGDKCVGVATIGRPVARKLDWNRIAEVTRLATDGTKNACSILYAAAARACEAMGFDSIQTYTLPEEGGVSLKAAGWTNEGMFGGGNWNGSGNGENSHKNRRTDQPMQQKFRWRKSFHKAGTVVSTHSYTPDVVLG